MKKSPAVLDEERRDFFAGDDLSSPRDDEDAAARAVFN
jgi:hypothetical protein